MPNAHHHGHRLSVPASIACVLAAGSPAQADEGFSYVRPSLVSACIALDTHIDELLDQHRTTDEFNEEAFFELIRLRYSARHSCTLGSYSEGIAIYERIPIRPVRSRPLR
jgi:hypothetical protein